jgi:hypothetical protein
MAKFLVPLKAIPSQSISIVLNGQPCVIDVRLLGARQYFSLSVNGVVICRNVLMVNLSRIVRAEYTGFIGDFAVVDTQGDEAPDYSGWGTRWLLLYFEPIEYTAA